MGGLGAFTMYSRWTSKEFRAVYKKVDSIEGCISGHDAYIAATNDVINQIQKILCPI
jgi:homoserine acetyltransferase